jgi:hypothetical protein
MRIGITTVGAMIAMMAGASARTEIIEVAQNDSTSAATKEIQSVLNAAKDSGQTNTAEIAKDQSANAAALSQAAQLAQRAIANGPDTAIEQKVAADAQQLNDSIKSLSPEAQKLLAQNSAPALRAPDPDAAPTKATPVPPAAADGKPKAAGAAADGKAGEVPVKVDNDIHIYAEGVAYFDSREAIGVFTDQVELQHPGFHLFCEQLEIYMIKDSEKKNSPAEPAAGAPKPSVGTAPPGGPGGAASVAGAANSDTTGTVGRTADPDAPAPKAGPAAPSTPPGAAAKPGEAPKSDTPQPDKNIRQAIARGPKVVIIKKTETAENQIGVCRNATYIGENGDIILRDMPLVQRGNHVHYAIDPSTYMVIHQNGKLDTHGPAKTDIIEEKEETPAAGVTPATAPAVPVAPPAKAGPPAKTPR